MGFWKGFVLAAVVVGVIAYSMGVHAGVAEECAKLVQSMQGTVYCQP